MSSPSSEDSVTVGEKERSSFSFWTSFAVVAFCIGSSVGNIFVFKRFFANYRFKYDPNAASEHLKRSAAQNPFTYGATASVPLPLPQVVVDDLRRLNMSVAVRSIPSEKELKQAYRRIALKTHPDRLALGDPRREQHARTFDEATGAYKRLLSCPRSEVK
jgi:hypothetical protein